MLNINGFRIRIDNSVLNLTISNVKLEKGKWGLLCRGAASKGAYELVCTLRTLKIPFNSISYWLRDEYDSKDFLHRDDWFK